ncbi:MAG: sigma-70 family RNA polymerase sigma factor [Caldicoprobacterales bacterium]|nr:sigma-70 family RNA polymerase sigma factor [Clostridiales bacterium]
MNKEFILQRIKPYLNDQGMLGEEDFNKLFHKLNKRLQYKVIDILIDHDIEIDYINRSKKRRTQNGEGKETGKVYAEGLNKLTNEQLCIMYQQGYSQALDTLVDKNKNLVWSRVKRYEKTYRHKLTEDDLFQDGVIGMITAAERFDSSREARFTTYALWWIDQQILRGIMNSGFTVRVPVHIFDSVNRLMRTFRDNPGFSKDQIFEILQEEGMSREKFESLINISQNILSTTSLNTLVGEAEDSELGSFIMDEKEPLIEEQIEAQALKQIIGEMLADLKPKEEKIMKLRFGIDDDQPRTLEEVGKEFGVTRERIRQIEARALRRLRHPTRARILKEFL